MRTAQRKAREVAERDQMLVFAALRMIQRDGFHNLTLARLASSVSYSKGTIYNHFTNREDLLIELSAESARRQLRYFQRIAELPWDGLRMTYGMALAYMRHAEVAPVLFECSITARTDAVCGAASEERLKRRDSVEKQLEEVVGVAVRRTVSEGAFSNPDISAYVAADALRATILGYSAMHLISRRFMWAGLRELGERLNVLASIMQGLGWSRLDSSDLEGLYREVADVVDPIAAEYSDA